MISRADADGYGKRIDTQTNRQKKNRNQTHLK
jgi:hypothetical protein